MSKKDQHRDEERIIEAVHLNFPAFMGGIDFARGDPDPPDFIGKDESGRKVGLELVSWLNKDQARAAERREGIRNNLLSVLKQETHPRPQSLSYVVVIPRWSNAWRNVPSRHHKELCREFHEAVRSTDNRWKALRAKHWKPVPEGSPFDYEAHESDLKRYPVLVRYISSIWFFQGLNTPASSEPWVDVNAAGPHWGLYDPNVAVRTLRSVIEQKIQDYHSKPYPRERLKAHNLDALFLLVYADPCRYHLNSPFQTCAQMRKSQTDGLLDAARRATKGLAGLPKVFDGIFLYYSLWASQWLALIWPEIRQFSVVDQQATPQVPLRARAP